MVTSRDINKKLRVYASVRFFESELNPMEVTRLLKLPPDKTYRKGEPHLIRTTKGKVLEYPARTMGFWSMSSKQWVNSPNLTTHIKWILDELEPKAENIALLLEQGIKADIYCYSSSDNDNLPNIPKTLMQRANILELPIDIEHY